MWNDIETDDDLLNFSVIADTAANMIIENKSQPVSIGISGSWGIGKSSMLKLIEKSVEKQKGEEKYICLTFDAWRYQGYEDAKKALLKQVSAKLLKIAESDKTLTIRIGELFKRVNWGKTIKVLGGVAGGIAGLATGTAILPLITLFTNSILNDPKKYLSDSNNVEELKKSISNVKTEVDDLLKEKKEENVPQEIEEFIDKFKNLLEEINIYLVIFVDDLDRCLPSTAISTLEAMRLLLFVPRMSFVIAADTTMIKSAVRTHFGNENISDELVTNYFDKLIQIPIEVPHLSKNEVKVYIFLLLLQQKIREDKTITESDYTSIKTVLLSEEKNCWNGDITQKTLENCCGNKKLDLLENIILAEQLSGIMVSTRSIAGNPRLIKRFLNSVMINKNVARLQNFSIPIPVLVKIELFQRCASESAMKYLLNAVANTDNGQPEFIKKIEQDIQEGKGFVAPDNSWETESFYENWFKMQPLLADTDLRSVLYLSRTKSVMLSTGDGLSVNARDIMSGLLVLKNYNQQFIDEIRKKIDSTDARLILNKLKISAETNQWEDDKMPMRMLHLAVAFDDLHEEFLLVLRSILPKKIKPALIPLLKPCNWTKDLLEDWSKNSNISQTVKKAIKLEVK
ncbi:MAG: hypothetical protein IJ158_10430 [Treponema sp.]|nr:hypothetical protein [Treponema sp.]